jgi:4-amino-4-deoxy-L-arabinose transferase
MENLIFGIITVVFCGITYYFSWKNHKKENWGSAILLLMLSGLAIYTFVSFDLFLHHWDERYHALVAKNMIRNPFTPMLYENPLLPYDYKMWTGNHIWVHKQPMSLWLMALSMKIFGVNEVAMRLPSMLMATTGIFLTFKVASFYKNKKIGYLAALLFSFNGLVLEMTSGRIATDHPDNAFLFFILLSIFLTTRFIESKKVIFNILAGITIGFAILSKWLPALIVLPIWLLFVYQSNKFSIKQILGYFALLMCVAVAVFLPWQIYIYDAFPVEAAFESEFNRRHFTEALEDHNNPYYYFLNQIRINYGELIYLPLIWFIWKSFQEKFNYKRLAILIWFVVPLIVFTIAKTKMQGYLLFTAPALFIMTAEFFYFLLEYKKNHKFKWLLNIILFLLIALPIRYGIERMKPFQKMDRNPQWVKELRLLNDESIENGVLFNYNRPIEAMYYTNLIVYNELPSIEKLKSLHAEGYHILLSKEGLPPQYLNLEKVEIKSLSLDKD